MQVQNTQTELKPKMAYNLKEAAAETSLSVPFLRNEIRDGNIKVCRIGKGKRRIVILHHDLQTYLENNYEVS